MRPKDYRRPRRILKSENARPWSKAKVSMAFNCSQQLEHFIALMAMHFGISRSSLITHAMNKLWNEVAPSIPTRDLQYYEKRLRAARMAQFRENEKIVERVREKRAREAKKRLES